MAYVNVGVKKDGLDIPTKKALKDAIAANPESVYVYSTSTFDSFADTADRLDIGVKYSVTGPNPYNSRKWYATLEKLPNRTIKVS